MRTKQELETENKTLANELERVKEELAARTAALASSGEDGWMVTVPNPAYVGNTLGVEFRGGRAFVGKSHPGAEWVVDQLEKDFGYRVTPMNAKDFKALAPVPVPEDKARKTIEMLSQPQVMGQ